MAKNQYYQRGYKWYNEEKTKEIDNLYKEHRESLYNQLQEQNIIENYQIAKQHYLKLYHQFSSLYRTQQKTNDFAKRINKTLNNWQDKNVQGRDNAWQQVTKMFDNFLKSNDPNNLGLEEKILGIANQILEETLGTQTLPIKNNNKSKKANILKELRTKNTKLVKKAKSLSEKDRKELEIKIQKAWEEKLNFAEIEKMVASRVGINKIQYFSVNDIMTFIVKPLISQRKEKIISGAGGWARLLNYNSALGFWYEACGAEVLGQVIEGLSNDEVHDSVIKIIHQAGTKGIADIKVNFTQKLNEEQKKENYTTEFGVQVKGYDTTKIFGDFFKSDSEVLQQDLTKFIRFSNHADKLAAFRAEPEQAKILNGQKESSIERPAIYTRVQANAMHYLSENKHLFDILGANNVGYLERSGFKWTKDVLKTIINTRQWLCFESKFKYDFTKRVGIL